jgi:hypothetical protein
MGLGRYLIMGRAGGWWAVIATAGLGRFAVAPHDVERTSLSQCGDRRDSVPPGKLSTDGHGGNEFPTSATGRGR